VDRCGHRRALSQLADHTRQITAVTSIANVLTEALVVGLLALLFVIVRFSIVSSSKTRAAAKRIHTPQVDGVEQIVGFPPPTELLALYQAPLVDSKEFYLVDRAKTPPAIWAIGAFNPLTAQDVRERKKIVEVDGIPIADDLDKGMYYVTRDGSVRLRSPDVRSGDVEVAPTVGALLGVERRDEWPERAGRAPVSQLDVAGVKFICEQDGESERLLKARLIELFEAKRHVNAAFLVRVRYEDHSNEVVALCLVAGAGKEEVIVGDVNSVFAALFGRDQHLDIIFVDSVQRPQLLNVCRPFFGAV